MNKNLAWVSGIAGLLLSGCATQQDRVTASGSFEYVKSQQRTSIEIPEGLDSPEFANDYELPELVNSDEEHLVGRNLEVRSPAVVIPLMTGSHVEEGSKGATILIDQVRDEESLDKSIWSSLITYLEDHDVSVDYFSPDKGILRTGWFEIYNPKDDENWFTQLSWIDKLGWFSEDQLPSKGRYEFVLAMKPHGRSGELSTSLMAFEQGDMTLSELNSLQVRREEVSMLNRVIGHYEYLNQVETNRRIALIRQGLEMEMGFDGDGNPAFIVDARYDIAWPRILLVLRKLGFNVKDMDKSNGLVFATYTDAEVNWWSDLFFTSEAKLLEYEDYRLKVTDLGGKSSITFMNDESEPFDAKMVADLFAPFEEVMADDGLDI